MFIKPRTFCVEMGSCTVRQGASLLSRRSTFASGSRLASAAPPRRPLSPGQKIVAADMMSNLRKLMGQAGSAAPQTSVAATAALRDPPAQYFSNNAPSWEELQAMVEQQQRDLGMPPVDLEAGPPSPAALRRTFGQSGEPKIKLYRDHATWCHKIILQLEEKRIPYTVEKINMRCYGDKPREFLAKVPSGLLPVLEVDGQVITESAVIQQILEQMYPQLPMLPAEGSQRERAAALMRLERRLFSDWLQWLCNGWGNDGNQAAFTRTIDAVDAALGDAPGPYFLQDFSLVDITFAPFLERIAASILYYKGLAIRGQGRWPNVDRWFAAMETRPAYLAFRSDHYTHVHDLPPQLGGCISLPEAAATAAAIDGTDGMSWHLPLPPLSATSLEAYSPGDQPQVDRVQAAARLVDNNAAVTRFALRGPGQPGPRPVSAPLADPTAIPAMQFQPEVDAALRHVAHALLVGAEAKQASGQALAVDAGGSGGLVAGTPVVASLAYVRDRVGVPRDLTYPAARQLRAHLNWVADQVAGAV